MAQLKLPPPDLARLQIWRANCLDAAMLLERAAFSLPDSPLLTLHPDCDPFDALAIVAHCQNLQNINSSLF
jgi:hypothetical protein